MKPRPTIFLSGVSHEFGSFRDAVENEIEMKGCFAEIPPVQAAGFRQDISRISKYAPVDLIGRDDELKLLDDAWMKVRRAESPRPHVLRNGEKIT